MIGFAYTVDYGDCNADGDLQCNVPGACGLGGFEHLNLLASRTKSSAQMNDSNGLALVAPHGRKNEAPWLDQRGGKLAGECVTLIWRVFPHPGPLPADGRGESSAGLSRCR